ncbi:MAG: leucine-rich repeat protein [Lachnospiraceae bacterium]|nr:leucine-rich repeat protein [Lachnospiraceae bacterium]
MNTYTTIIDGTAYTFEPVAQLDSDTYSALLKEAKNVRNRITIPDSISVDDFTLIPCAIGKKAFLSSKALRQISLPAAVTLIDDWAFGKCSSLRSVIIRGSSDVIFGRGAFEEDESLESICIGYDKADDKACLLALAAGRMGMAHLLDPALVKTTGWYEAWDRALCTIIDSDDEAGYYELFLCGEEDITYSYQEFVARSRFRKVLLALNRVAHPEGLSTPFRQKFVSYISDRGLFETWQVIKTHYADDLRMIQLLCDIGAVNRTNIDRFIEAAEGLAVIKAFLIVYKRNNYPQDDFFGGLEL